MKRDRINVLIEKAYGNRYDLGAPVRTLRPRSHFYMTKVRPVLVMIAPVAAALVRKRILISSLVFTAILIGMTIHYYNLLVISQQNMRASMGHVQALQQRRNDTAVNLSKAVLDYAEHERAVLSGLVALRSLSQENRLGSESLNDLKAGAQRLEQLQGIINQAGIKAPTADIAQAPGAGQPSAGNVQAQGGAQPPALMSLSALAEQYPDLKLSTNFQTLMNLLDQIEKDLAATRMKHDDLVNLYATNVMVFPSNVFARLFGFETHPYFEANEEAKQFKLITY